MSDLRVTSHVSRDLEQSAAYFNTFEKVVWEYISNSLDAAKDDELVTVEALVSKNKIVVADNGKGMSRSELAAFFQMHGENIHRKRGKRVRGRFGTGKSAAFGLANSLEIETVQCGLQNVVQLTRKDIKEAEDGKPIPVRNIVVDEVTLNNDGTTITVTKFISRKRPKSEKVIQYIERHLSRYRGRAQVSINGHQCKLEEISYRKHIQVKPPPHLQEHTGEIVLNIKIAPTPLDDERVGIDILSHGIWHETTQVGIENKEQTQYIFGDVDVPILEDNGWEIPPFDNTRSIRLNDQNPVVAMLLGWISQELEKVRLQLVKEEQERRNSEQAKKLAKEADRIAKVLNDDFAQQELALENARKIQNKTGVMLANENAGETSSVTPGGGEEPSGLQEAGNPHGNGTKGKSATEGDTPRPGPSLIEGTDPGVKKKIERGQSKRRRAIFSINYENVTPSEPRSRYNGLDKTIYINLDHLQISSALQASNGRTSGKAFREMCYEVAAVEYAIALEHERLGQEEVEFADDALFNVRKTIDRIVNRFSEILYT